MKRIGFSLLALALVACATSQAVAQQQRRGRGGPGGGLNGVALLSQKSVQDELKLTPEQVKQVDEQMTKMRESAGELRNLGREEARAKFQERAKANQDAANGILKDDQKKRFKQITLQLAGAVAFNDSDVLQALSLTAEQKDKIKTIQEASQTERRALFQAAGGGGGGGEEARKKSDELRKTTNEKLIGVLTTEQQAKWKELTGEPFKGEIRRPQGGGRPAAGAATNRRNRPNQSTRAEVPQGPFQLASFKPDGENDDAGKSEAGKKDRGARHKARGHKHPGQHHHARGASRHEGPPPRAQAMRHEGSRHGHWPQFAGPPPRHRHGPAFAHYGIRHGYRSHGPDVAHHRRDRGHGPQCAARSGHHRAAPGFAGHPGHHGPPPAMAGHHGPHHHFASWSGHHGHGPGHFGGPNHFDGPNHFGGPGHLDRGRPDGHGRPHPPGDRDRKRSDLDRTDDHVASNRSFSPGNPASDSADGIARLSKLQQSLDTFARELEELRRELRR